MEEYRSEHGEALALYNAIVNCDDVYLVDKIKSAMDILFEGLNRYGPDQLFSSFNGGKDAVVIMHLLRAVTAKFSETNGAILRAKFIYFAIEDEFPEVLEYIEESKALYALDLITYEGGIVKGLTEHVENMAATGLNTPAFVLGTRKADPNCGDQEAFSPSSSWIKASFMRCNPILDWDYGHVWHFLRTFQLKYCSLYDRGYTSLGKRSDTNSNPILQKNYTEGDFWPAYLLSDWTQERAGRGYSENSEGNGNEANITNFDQDGEKITIKLVVNASEETLSALLDQTQRSTAWPTTVTSTLQSWLQRPTANSLLILEGKKDKEVEEALQCTISHIGSLILRTESIQE